MIDRLEMLSKEIPISILYGSDSWMDKTAGYLIQCLRDPSYVSVQVKSLTINSVTVKPALRGHLWDKDKFAL